jgi:gamma-glutamyl phosphate reductase
MKAFLGFEAAFFWLVAEHVLRNASKNFTKVNKSGTIVHIGMSTKSLKPKFCKH